MAEIKPVTPEEELLIPDVNAPAVEERTSEEASVLAAPELNQTVQPKPLDIDTTPKVEEKLPLPEVDTTPKPEVTIEPTIEETKIVEPIKAEEVKAPEVKEVPEVPVTDAQTVKSNELANQATEDAIKEKEQAKTKDEFNKALVAGATIEELAVITNNNPELKEEFRTSIRAFLKNQSTQEYVTKYSGMSNEQMKTAVDNSDVVIGSALYKQLNPTQRASFEQYYKEATAANTKEDDDKKFASDENKIISNSKQEEEISNFVGLNVREASKNLFNTPEITASSAALSSKKNEINKVNDKLDEDRLRKKIIAKYPGFPSGFINAKIADERRDLIREKNGLVNEYNSELGNYTRLKDNATQELDLLKYEDTQNRLNYNTQLGLYETRRQERRADMSAEAQAKADRENTIFEAKNKAITSDIKFQRDIALLEYKAKLSDEGVTGKWLERDDGTYFAKSDGTIEKVLEAVITPGVNSNIVFENGQAYSEVYDINNGGVGFTSQNTSLGASERELLNAPNGTRIPTRLNKDQLSANNPGGKECGEYVNDIVAKTVGTKIGSSWNSKLSYASESVGEVGSVAVWQVDPSNKESSKFGHAGVIVGETSDNKQWLIKSSNIKGQGVVSLVKVPKTVINGYKTTNIIGKEKVFNEAQKQFLDKIDAGDYAGKKEVKGTANSLGLSATDVFKYKSENIATQKKEDYNTALQLLDKMVAAGGGDGLSDAIGIFSWARDVGDNGEITFDPGTDAADFKAQYDALVDGLTLPNLDKMSGVLTDKDIELLKNASKGGLSLRMSEGDFKNAVEDLRGALNRAARGIKIPEGQVIFTDDDGIQYSKSTLMDEVQRLISAGDWTPTQAKQWLEDNNLNDKL